MSAYRIFISLVKILVDKKNGLSTEVETYLSPINKSTIRKDIVIFSIYHIAYKS